MMRVFWFISFCFFCLSASAQPPGKEIKAARINHNIKIDGKLDNDEWKDASVIEGFTELRPVLNDLENPSKKTTLYLAYNDLGIFVGGLCRDDKDSISSELVGRDGFGNNDFVGVIFDTYKDRLNAFEYFITPLNEQMDAKFSQSNDNGEDFSWNSIFYSQTSITHEGWTFEMFIPFASIRFSKENVQDWGLNFVRRRRKSTEQFFWNPIDPNISGFLTQAGSWMGLKDIDPPLRLQLSPYVSYYANHFPLENGKDLNSQFNGGMDVKLGLNQAFTLDATLIPDFGQVQSDQRVLNLTPFEVQFNDYRPFFTEGTDLFTKGNFFYSRRIGGLNIDYSRLSADQEIVSAPAEASLINATKISGRTKNGLGIGVLNAITAPVHVKVFDINTEKESEVEVQPLINYSIAVFDQTFGNNSSVSFINTNVLRNGSAHDANVSSALFNLNNKKNTYNLSGKIALSTFSGAGVDKESQTGYSQSLSFGRSSGKVNWNFSHELVDRNFNSNDLGFFTNNNYMNHGLWIGTRWTKPTKVYNNLRLNFNIFASHLYAPIKSGVSTLQNAEVNFNAHMQTKNLWSGGGIIEYSPDSYDYYEPRNFGDVFRRGSSFFGGTWWETNNAKKYFVEVELLGRRFIDFYNGYSLFYSIENNYRFNSKLLISHQISSNPRWNNIGFSHFEGGSQAFARRFVTTIENELSAKYNFTNRMGLTLVARHYNSSVRNQEMFRLMDDGNLRHAGELKQENGQRNINFFNVDMVYTWQFAQGSFVNVVWKNAISSFDQNHQFTYMENIKQTIQTNQNNNLSVKVIYFIDYNTLKNKKKYSEFVNTGS
ncbi:MAG: DUF5916 domain-containing protein [Saprospiraceae bacterium]